MTHTAEDADPDELEMACRSMFERHRVHAFGGIFHVPDVERYPALFAWDSGYNVLAMRHLEPELAVEEMRTLYRASTLDSELLSHQRYVPGAEAHQASIEELFGPMFEEDRSPFIDPPTAAYAAARLSLQFGSRVDDLLDAAVSHLAALTEHRTLPGSSLPVALHPFETGTEGSPIMDDVAPMKNYREAVGLLRRLTETAMAAGMDPARALAAGHGFVVEDPAVCGWYLLALEEVSEACSRRGRLAEAQRCRDTAAEVAKDLVKRLWWPEGSLFGGRDVLHRRGLTAINAAGVLPAASRTLHGTSLAAQLIDAHLRPGCPMWGPHGFAAGRVMADGRVGDHVQWRGNAVWGATVYWAHLALLNAGHPEWSRLLRRQLEGLIMAHGFRELYDAWSGAPGGAGKNSGFTWPALVLEMRAGEEAASRS